MKILLSISMLWAHFANILCVGRGRERKFYSVSYETEFDVIVFSFQDGACSFPPSEVGANDQGVLLLVVSSRDAREGKIVSDKRIQDKSQEVSRHSELDVNQTLQYIHQQHIKG